MGGTHNAAPGAPSDLLARLESDDRFRRVCSRLAEGRPASAGGLWGSSVSIFLAALSHHATAPLLVAVPSIEDAERVADDLRLFTEAEVALFPAWEALPAEDAVPSPLHAQRVGLSRRLSAAATQTPPALIVAPVQALLQPVADADAVAAATLELRVGGRARIEAL
ncbi:hypothetical protein HQ576_19995, partial [bacterium]|nr:hypothetical protein [bacterium]